MEIVYVVLAMILVGVVIGLLAGVIWKNNKPIGTGGDILVSVITAVVVGLLDIVVIPAMGLDSLKWIAVATEPPLAALFVLWIVRRVKRAEPVTEVRTETATPVEIGEDAIICSYCGESIQPKDLALQDKDTLTCPSCGNMLTTPA